MDLEKVNTKLKIARIERKIEKLLEIKKNLEDHLEYDVPVSAIDITNEHLFSFGELVFVKGWGSKLFTVIRYCNTSVEVKSNYFIGGSITLLVDPKSLELFSNKL